jgi:hypothetical protein
MDRNLMQCCEMGVCFVEECPGSVAIKPLSDIVDKITRHVDAIQHS